MSCSVRQGWLTLRAAVRLFGMHLLAHLFGVCLPVPIGLTSAGLLLLHSHCSLLGLVTVLHAVYSLLLCLSPVALIVRLAVDGLYTAEHSPAAAN